MPHDNSVAPVDHEGPPPPAALAAVFLASSGGGGSHPIGNGGNWSGRNRHRGLGNSGNNGGNQGVTTGAGGTQAGNTHQATNVVQHPAQQWPTPYYPWAGTIQMWPGPMGHNPSILGAQPPFEEVVFTRPSGLQLPAQLAYSQTLGPSAYSTPPLVTPPSLFQCPTRSRRLIDMVVAYWSWRAGLAGRGALPVDGGRRRGRPGRWTPRPGGRAAGGRPGAQDLELEGDGGCLLELEPGGRGWPSGAGCLAAGPASGAGLDAGSGGRAAGGWPGGQDLEGTAAAWRRSARALRGCAQATGHGSQMRERERPGIWSGRGPGG
ncbi:hypothetical protein E2562_017552 [Oryza meyeriana var. granulata]|uniref:Uncharacterized protein n=1 Tax=Oryza meyeriana var. granulata TaxID=110450 RepID=A0A6G1C615_9ORYZ|nr:hypothetical protein E2562_017552 [Oryza meyeriana var. granulata]